MTFENCLYYLPFNLSIVLLMLIAASCFMMMKEFYTNGLNKKSIFLSNSYIFEAIHIYQHMTFENCLYYLLYSHPPKSYKNVDFKKNLDEITDSVVYVDDDDESSVAIERDEG